MGFDRTFAQFGQHLTQNQCKTIDFEQAKIQYKTRMFLASVKPLQNTKKTRGVNRFVGAQGAQTVQKTRCQSFLAEPKHYKK